VAGPGGENLAIEGGNAFQGADPVSPGPPAGSNQLFPNWATGALLVGSGGPEGAVGVLANPNC